MRQLIFILALAALAYFGWNYYKKQKEAMASPPAEEVVTEAPAPPAAERPRAPIPPAETRFVSKIRVPETPPGQKQMAPPGYVYITGRVSVETANGVIALVPGDLVKLLQRKNDGTVRVTNDLADFEVKADQVTQDTEIAQIAEKRDFEMRLRR
jgi:hypothetical protein